MTDSASMWGWYEVNGRCCQVLSKLSGREGSLPPSQKRVKVVGWHGNDGEEDCLGYQPSLTRK